MFPDYCAAFRWSRPSWTTSRRSCKRATQEKRCHTKATQLMLCANLFSNLQILEAKIEDQGKSWLVTISFSKLESLILKAKHFYPLGLGIFHYHHHHHHHHHKSHRHFYDHMIRRQTSTWPGHPPDSNRRGQREWWGEFGSAWNLLKQALSTSHAIFSVLGILMIV